MVFDMTFIDTKNTKLILWEHFIKSCNVKQECKPKERAFKMPAENHTISFL
jgi:hypothetical protein